MSEIKIVSKASHKVLQELNGQKAALSEASVVVVKVNMDDVQQIVKEGKNAVITLKNGEKIVIENFFTGEGYETENSLVLDDDQNKLLWAQFTDANGAMLDNITFNYIDTIEPLLYHDGASNLWGWLAVPLTAAGIILWAGSSSGGDGKASRVLDKPIIDPPNGKDPITGKAEPNSQVEITFPNGKKEIVDVGPDGTWTAPNPGLKDGDEIKVIAKDKDGNVSPPATAIVDAIAPPAPLVDPINPKDPITGEAEPDSKVILTFPDGKTETVDVGPDGKWSAPNPGLKDGDKVDVIAKDKAGNVSPPTEVIVDGIAPPAPMVDPINPKDPITGEAEPDSKVILTFPDGKKETVDVGPDGKWSAPNPGLKDGDKVDVIAKDKAGNVSPPTEVIVDGIAPPAPMVDPINPKDPITGEAEPDSEVILTFPDGKTETVDVGPDGKWSAPNPGLKDGDKVDVIAKDKAGNVSPPTEVIVDGIAPPAPMVDPINPKDPITGEAEPDSEVILTFPDGKTETVDVGPDGSWSAPNPGLKDGDKVDVIAKDKAGNVSPPTEVIVDGVAPAAPVIDPLTETGPVTGTAEPGSKVEVTFPNGKTETTTAGPDGVWTVPNPGLKDGDKVTATATDKANNTSPPATAIFDTTIPTATATIDSYTDDAAPQTGDFKSGTSTNDSTPTLNIISQGTLAAGEVIAVYRDGVKVGTATLAANGQYHFTDNGLVNGQSYKYTTAVENAAGKPGAFSPEFILNVDTTVPSEITIGEVIDNVEYVVGPLQPGDVTNDTTPTVKGSGAEPDALITLKDSNGNVLGTTTADANGNWVVEPAPGHELIDGPHTLQVTQTDKAGNEGPAKTFDLTVDTSAPTQSAHISDVIDDVDPVQGSVADNGYTNDTAPTIQGSISAALAAGEKVVVLRDGVVIGTATVTGTNWTYQDSGLVDGKQYQYTVRVEDAAGNRGGESNAYNINVDSTLPTQTITIDSAMDNVGPIQTELSSGATTDDSTPTLKGMVSSALAGNEVIAIYRDGVKVGTATVSGTTWNYTDAGLSNGKHSYTAKVEDAAGNSGAVSNPFDLTYISTGSSNTAGIIGIEDDVAPVVGNIANGGYTNDHAPMLHGDLATALAAGETVAVYRDGIKIGTATVTGTTWTYQDSNLVDAQQYGYSVAVENAAGLAGAESPKYIIHIDNTAPSQTVTITEIVDNKDPVAGPVGNGGFTNDDTPEIKGSLSAALAAGEVVNV